MTKIVPAKLLLKWRTLRIENKSCMYVALANHGERNERRLQTEQFCKLRHLKTLFSPARGANILELRSSQSTIHITKTTITKGERN